MRHDSKVSRSSIKGVCDEPIVRLPLLALVCLTTRVLTGLVQGTLGGVRLRTDGDILAVFCVQALRGALSWAAHFRLTYLSVI